MRSRVPLLRRASIVVDWRLTTLPLDAIEAREAERGRARHGTPLVGPPRSVVELPIPNEDAR